MSQPLSFFIPRSKQPPSAVRISLRSNFMIKRGHYGYLQQDNKQKWNLENQDLWSYHQTAVKDVFLQHIPHDAVSLPPQCLRGVAPLGSHASTLTPLFLYNTLPPPFSFPQISVFSLGPRMFLCSWVFTEGPFFPMSVLPNFCKAYTFRVRCYVHRRSVLTLHTG